MKKLFHWWHRWKVYSASPHLVVLRCKCGEEVRGGSTMGMYWYDMDRLTPLGWRASSLCNNAALSAYIKDCIGLDQNTPDGVDDRLGSSR